jgi:hypothetical protein
MSLKVVIDEGGRKGNCFVNNYFNSTERFSHAKHGGYFVTRLDAYTLVLKSHTLSDYIDLGVMPSRLCVLASRSPP